MQLAILTAKVEAGFREVTRRLDDHRERLVSIDGEVKATNGRVTRHDEQIRTLFRDLTARRDRRDREAAGRHERIGGVLTFDLVDRFIKFGGWIAGGLLWLLHLVGKL